MTYESRIGIFNSAAPEIRERVIKSLEAEAVIVPHAGILPLSFDNISLERFGWIVFTDSIAADVFVRTREDVGRPFAEQDEIFVCSLRDDVSVTLRQHLIHTDIVPWGGKTQDAVAAIEEYEGRDLGELNILFVGPDSAETKLVPAGLNASYVGAYKAEFAGDTARIKALILGGGMDAFVISDTKADLADLEALFPDVGGRAVLAGSVVYAAGEDALAELRESGVRARLLPDRNIESA